MVTNKSALFAAVVALGMFGVAGCGDKTANNDAGTTAGATAGQEGAMEKAGKTVDQGGAAVKEGAKEAVKPIGDAAAAVGDAAVKTGQTVKEGVKETGQAVAKTGEMAGEAVGGVAKGVGDAAVNADNTVKLTMGVKNALIASKVDASTVNVDTDVKTNTVMISGTVPSAGMQKTVTDVATKAVKDAGSSFKVKNNTTVKK